ncbi:hypothetical protein [Streptomyces sp. NPDC014894]|uniref:COG4315 family predicted lipoprotein n=1 Tax=unclassified Streptomyces TaxID=2593676 RepID=UPI0036FA8078
MSTSRFTAFATAVSAALLALTACTGPDKIFDEEPVPTQTTEARAPAAAVKVADSSLGRILVDGTGRTLYGFTKDRRGSSTCDADCIAVWPALTSTERIAAGPGTEPALLTGTKVGEGAEQAVYGDWPLYYYVGDATPGDMNGQGLEGAWFVVGADGRLIKKPA